ncbi:LysR family transcriptional regulator [Luteimonas fraxinea]|jgi:DNA-binding transcriptional LysR family regulator|uniref:LysR family transcriptional regulator n=1 Tax=Luteimonas fraxinea TaxID=2901869 RepID=A0ABS8UAG3_9GAMM|nr:LysR family transcriptional regulator [Luteimonas fraxinea]MCD9096488.1 LysR family transcriptional regulator [Luteimonas fraxinea]UHH10070.1 LysR family transcriptional regulator [Luteimonas fraxinea]
MQIPANMSLRQLRYFAEAAELGQFSQAARKLHVSQSVITTAVAQLETLLGLRLFDRMPHGVALTAEGHRFHQHVRHILDTLQDALSEPMFLANTLAGTVRVGASYTVLGYFLPSLLARFKRSYPLVEIDLIDMDRVEIERGVAEGALDFGLCIISNMVEPYTLKRQLLIRSRRQLWLAESHPLAQQPVIGLADVAAYPYIMLKVDEGEASALRYWQSVQREPNVAFRTSSLEALRGLVAYGFGVSILSDMVYRPWSLEGRRIDVRTLDDAVPPMEVGLVWRPDEALSAPANALHQFLVFACSA